MATAATVVMAAALAAKAAAAVRLVALVAVVVHILQRHTNRKSLCICRRLAVLAAARPSQLRLELGAPETLQAPHLGTPHLLWKGRPAVPAQGNTVKRTSSSHPEFPKWPERHSIEGYRQHRVEWPAV